MNYFKKEILANRLTLNGTSLNWIPVQGGDGIIQLEDNDPSVPGLRQLAQRGVLGVEVISQAEYEALEKKRVSLTSSPPKELLRLFNPRRPSPPKPEKGVASVEPPPPPAPVTEPVADFKPNLKRLKAITEPEAPPAAAQ